jgi:hypothetical protein
MILYITLPNNFIFMSCKASSFPLCPSTEKNYTQSVYFLLPKRERTVQGVGIDTVKD